MNIQKGQDVIMVGIGNQARYGTKIHKATISTIGRKWFTVDCEVSHLGRDNKFSLEDGRCDGKGYSPEWQVFESEEDYKESKERPALRREVETITYGLTYKQLAKVLEFIKTL